MTISPTALPQKETVSIQQNDEAVLEHKTRLLPSVEIDKRRSFHFPSSVLAFIQEEYETSLTDSQLMDISAITKNTTFDDDDDIDSHPSLEETRQPEPLTKELKHCQSTSNEEDEERDTAQIVSLSSTIGSGHTFDMDENEGDMPKNSLPSCLELLSAEDLDLNRLALQRLALLTRGRTLSGLYRSEELASIVLVYGGQFGSLENRLRYAFATMICDSPHGNVGLHRSSTVSSSQTDGDLAKNLESLMYGNDAICSQYESDDEYSVDSFDSESETDKPQGKSRGALHLQGLKVLASALTQVSHTILDASDDECEEDDAMECVIHRTIPLKDTIWRNLIHSLVHNIEANHSADITGYSLKILRLLHTLHPDMVQPLLQQTLFPHLVHLQDYGQSHLFPMIYNESTYLLRRANYLW